MRILENNDVDERYHTTNLYTSIEGTVICSTLSSFSIVASIAIMMIIFRSHDGLCSVYHRVLLCMSIGNLLASISMSLNTLPMPSDMPYTGFEGLHIGNQTTCNIQGFIFTFGAAIEVVYFVMLLVYYYCFISLKMQNGTFRRFIEPMLHLICISIGLTFSISSVAWDLMNPTVDKNWCARSLLPFWCADEPESCIRGSAKQENGSSQAVAVSYSAIVFIAIICMTCIIWTVYNNERSTQKRNLLMLAENEMSRNSGQIEMIEESRNVDANALVSVSSSHEHHGNERDGDLLISEESRKQHETKVIAVQIAAYFLSILIVSMNNYLTIFSSRRSSWAAYYHLISRPLHGLMNFIIFIGHKAYERRRVDETLGWKDALWKVLLTRHESVFLFDNVKEVLDTRSDDSKCEMGNDDKADEGASHHDNDVDPIRLPTLNIMPHLNDKMSPSNDTARLPPRNDVSESLDSDDLPSRNDGDSYGKYMFRNDAGSGGGLSAFEA